MAKITPLPGFAVLAPLGFEELAKQELASFSPKRFGQLLISDQSLTQPLYWQQNIWEELYQIDFDSINDCVKALTSLQRNWWPYFWDHFRRGKLIASNLPFVKGEPITFGQPLRTSPLGSWTLITEKLAIASTKCTSFRPNGDWQFAEDKLGPPSRAYLKLWEVFSRTGVTPGKMDVCLDLGASPGGWTWVLEKLGCQVIAYDRSPLRDDLMRKKSVTFVKGDAFSVSEDNLSRTTWLFCDVICYPEKLLEFLKEKIIPSSIKNAVCTIKFQGSHHQPEVIQKFLELPHSQVIHLSANKHELTWIYRKPDETA